MKYTKYRANPGPQLLTLVNPGKPPKAKLPKKAKLPVVKRGAGKGGLAVPRKKNPRKTAGKPKAKGLFASLGLLKPKATRKPKRNPSNPKGDKAKFQFRFPRGTQGTGKGGKPRGIGGRFKGGISVPRIAAPSAFGMVPKPPKLPKSLAWAKSNPRPKKHKMPRRSSVTGRFLASTGGTRTYRHNPKRTASKRPRDIHGQFLPVTSRSYRSNPKRKASRPRNIHGQFLPVVHSSYRRNPYPSLYGPIPRSRALALVPPPVKKPRRRKGYRRNPATLTSRYPQAMAVAKMTGGVVVGYFGANAISNIARTSPAMPVGLARYADYVGQGLALAAFWFAPWLAGKISPDAEKLIEPYRGPATVGALLSLVTGFVQKTVSPTAWRYLGTPGTLAAGLSGADLDVYEAALRGYPGAGVGLNEGWADYVPGDEQLLAAVRKQDGMGEYVAEPLEEYVAEPLEEYVAEPLEEYVAEPLDGIQVEEAMAGATNQRLNSLLTQAGLGQAPAAEEIGAVVDGEAVEAAMQDSDLTAEYEEPGVVGVQVTEAMAGVEVEEAVAGDDDEGDDEDSDNPDISIEIEEETSTSAAPDVLPAKRRRYFTRRTQAVPGGGIFGLDIREMRKPRKAPAVNAGNLRMLVRDGIARRRGLKNAGQICSETYAEVKKQLGIGQGNEPFRKAYLMAFKAELAGGAGKERPLRNKPANGAPMLVSEIRPVKPVKPIQMIKGQQAGEVGGSFFGHVFSAPNT